MDLDDYQDFTAEFAVFKQTIHIIAMPDNHAQAQLLRDFCSSRGIKYAPSNAYGLIYTMLGLNGEAGEAIEQIKKMMRNDGGKLTHERHEKLKLELGDVLWYLAAAANEMGLSLSAIARANISKLSERKENGTLKERSSSDVEAAATASAFDRPPIAGNWTEEEIAQLRSTGKPPVVRKTPQAEADEREKDAALFDALIGGAGRMLPGNARESGGAMDGGDKVVPLPERCVPRYDDPAHIMYSDTETLADFAKSLAADHEEKQELDEQCQFEVPPRDDSGVSHAYCYTHGLEWPYQVRENPYGSNHRCPIGILDDHMKYSQHIERLRASVEKIDARHR